jgi:hypothetical protein
MIADKIEGPASARFKHFVGSTKMNSVSINKVKNFSNLIVVKGDNSEIVFDINAVNL